MDSPECIPQTPATDLSPGPLCAWGLESLCFLMVGEGVPQVSAPIPEPGDLPSHVAKGASQLCQRCRLQLERLARIIQVCIV